MNIKFDDLVRWKGVVFAKQIMADYKKGKIKNMSDLLVYYNINKKKKGG